MIVCHCNGTTDSQIRDAVDVGGKTPGEVGRVCGAGESCGGCVEAIRDVLREYARTPRAISVSSGDRPAA